MSKSLVLSGGGNCRSVNLHLAMQVRLGYTSFELPQMGCAS